MKKEYEARLLAGRINPLDALIRTRLESSGFITNSNFSDILGELTTVTTSVPLIPLVSTPKNWLLKNAKLKVFSLILHYCNKTKNTIENFRENYISQNGDREIPLYSFYTAATEYVMHRNLCNCSNHATNVVFTIKRFPKQYWSIRKKGYHGIYPLFLASLEQTWSCWIGFVILDVLLSVCHPPQTWPRIRQKAKFDYQIVKLLLWEWFC